jgi:hypothetical protein
VSDTLLDVEAVVGASAGLSRTVLQYTLEMKRAVDRAKQPGFDETAWEPLAGFVAVEAFVRVGPFKDMMRWPEYVSFLTGWAPRSHWECSFRRITEIGDRVFLELEERTEPGDSSNAANSLSVFEFDESPKLCRLDVYLQLPKPSRAGVL